MNPDEVCAACAALPKGVEGHAALFQDVAAHPWMKGAYSPVYSCRRCGSRWRRSHLRTGTFRWQWLHRDESRSA